MTFRYARHTNNLKLITKFYTQILGLQLLGSFENHSKYNGVFLGYPNMDWHLEFTESDSKAEHFPDHDDLIVLYVNSDIQLNAIIELARSTGIESFTSKNPYWQKKGIELKDPDNFGVVLTVKQKVLDSEDPLTQLIRSKGIDTWESLLHYTRNLPYARISDKSQLELVISENRGTCSSKHALLKKVADLNRVDGVKLILGIYKMNQGNTPGIGNHISQSPLDYVPEAHCYLSIYSKKLDMTKPNATIAKIENDILEEKEITPAQTGAFKIEFHKKYIHDWRKKNNINLTFEQIWSLRERCIEELSTCK